MQLVFSPTLCPDLLLPEVLNLAKAAGFSRLELFRAYTESTPVHRDWSVPMVRTAIADADVQLTGFNIRNLTGRKADSDERNLAYNLRQLEWDIHLGRALGIKTLNTKGGCPHGRGPRRPHRRRQHAPRQHPRHRPQLGHPPRQPPARTGRLSIGAAGTARAGACAIGHRPPAVGGRANHALCRGPLPIALVSSTCATSRAERPVPFGEGELPFAELFKLLADSGYDGPLVVELEEVDWDEPLPAAIAAREYVEALLG